MQVWRKLIGGEGGTAAVLFALCLTALLGFTALVTDSGILFLNQSRVASAVDSAVLAGAQELPGNPDTALAVARTFAEANGVTDAEAVFSVSEDRRQIVGEATRRVGLYFARVLGFTQGEVKARAAARVGALTAATGCAPLGVLEDEFEIGVEYTLKEGAGGGQHKGWFGCLRLGGSGASVYRDNLKYGYQGEIKVGDVIPVEPGNMSGPTSQGINYRLNLCPHYPKCSGEHYERTCPRVLLVPIVRIEETNPGGSVKSVKVVAFGAFLVDEAPGCGHENQVTGHFVETVFPGTTGDGTAEYGAYGVQLVE